MVSFTSYNCLVCNDYFSKLIDKLTYVLFRSDVTSHLRAIATSNDDVPFPQDFNARCSFVITGEKGNSRPLTTVTYGSFVRLKHKASNCSLIAVHQEDTFDHENCYNSVVLRSFLTPIEELASTWCVTCHLKFS